MALFATPYFDPPVLALGWAVFLGGALQLAIQIPALKRIAMLPRPTLNLRAAWAGTQIPDAGQMVGLNAWVDALTGLTAWD